MKKFLLKILLIFSITLTAGFLVNIVLCKIRYTYTLKSFLKITEQPNLLIGSSRIHHNIDTALLPNSFQIMSKPNLHGIDQFNILTKVDLKGKKNVISEYDESGISTSINQLIFWDPLKTLSYLRFVQKGKDVKCIVANSFFIREFLKQFKGFELNQRLLTDSSTVYLGMKKSTTQKVKLGILSYITDSLPFAHSKATLYFSNTPCNSIYNEIYETALKSGCTYNLIVPFGQYTSLELNKIKYPPLKVNPIELRNIGYLEDEIYDYRHLNAKGAVKITNELVTQLHKTKNIQ